MKGKPWLVVAILAVAVILLLLAGRVASAEPLHGDAPAWAWVSGPVVPGAHAHTWVNHVWVRAGWSGAVYTCNVTYRTMRAAQDGRVAWLSCLGQYGKR